MIPIFSHTQKTFCDALYALFGKGAMHAAHLYADWFRTGECSLDAPWMEPQARSLVEKMLSSIDFSLPDLVMHKQEGEAIKFLLQFRDGKESESVVIPMEAGATFCLSSQVGCKMGCHFCETGRMGLVRHLSAQEIVAQLFYARFKLKASIRNIVFMGMGEPFDNFEEVMQAIRILTDPRGLAFGPSRISVSTSGRVDGIYRFMEEADPAINLAVSVNASNDVIRQRIMPINRKWNMAELKKAMRDYCAHPRRQILIEYVLLKGVNDSLECAEELADYLEGLNVKVNLIPYNHQSRERFAPPEEDEVRAFYSRMRARGYPTFFRQSKGRQIMAACGQLGKKSLPENA